MAKFLICFGLFHLLLYSFVFSVAFFSDQLQSQNVEVHLRAICFVFMSAALIIAGVAWKYVFNTPDTTTTEKRRNETPKQHAEIAP